MQAQHLHADTEEGIKMVGMGHWSVSVEGLKAWQREPRGSSMIKQAAGHSECVGNPTSTSIPQPIFPLPTPPHQGQ